MRTLQSVCCSSQKCWGRCKSSSCTTIGASVHTSFLKPAVIWCAFSPQHAASTVNRAKMVSILKASFLTCFVFLKIFGATCNASWKVEWCPEPPLPCCRCTGALRAVCAACAVLQQCCLLCWGCCAELGHKAALVTSELSFVWAVLTWHMFLWDASCFGPGRMGWVAPT